MGMSEEQEIRGFFIAFLYVYFGLGRTLALGVGCALRSTHFLQHCLGGSEPVTKRYCRIIFIVLGSLGNLLNIPRRV